MFTEEELELALEADEPEAPEPEPELAPPWEEAIGIRLLRRQHKGSVTPRSLPLLREACVSAPRPCLHISCRHNLYTDVTFAGSLVLRDAEPDAMPASGSCALDVAEEGAHTLEAVAAYLGITKERARQIEETALAKLRGDSLLRELYAP